MEGWKNLYDAWGRVLKMMPVLRVQWSLGLYIYNQNHAMVGKKTYMDSMGKVLWNSQISLRQKMSGQIFPDEI